MNISLKNIIAITKFTNLIKVLDLYFQVNVYNSLGEFLNDSKDFSKKFHLIIIDHNLASFEEIYKLKENFLVPIVKYINIENLHEIVDESVDGFIIKPSCETVIRSTIEILLNKKQPILLNSKNSLQSLLKVQQKVLHKMNFTNEISKENLQTLSILFKLIDFYSRENSLNDYIETFNQMRTNVTIESNFYIFEQNSQQQYFLWNLLLKLLVLNPSNILINKEYIRVYSSISKEFLELFEEIPFKEESDYIELYWTMLND
jgi:hypothetical protein